METIDKNTFVYPISNSDNESGVGAFVDGLFITAAHVINKSTHPSFTFINYKKVYLNPEEARLPIGSDTIRDENSFDLAVFDLSDIADIKGFQLEPKIINGPSQALTYRVNTDYSSPNPFRLVSSSITIEKCMGNFILGHASPMLVPGDSGCPLIQNNHFVGLLCAGMIGTDICAFISAESISKQLKDNNIIKN